ASTSRCSPPTLTRSASLGTKPSATRASSSGKLTLIFVRSPSMTRTRIMRLDRRARAGCAEESSPSASSSLTASSAETLPCSTMRRICRRSSAMCCPLSNPTKDSRLSPPMAASVHRWPPQSTDGRLSPQLAASVHVPGRDPDGTVGRPGLDGDAARLVLVPIRMPDDAAPGTPAGFAGEARELRPRPAVARFQVHLVADVIAFGQVHPDAAVAGAQLPVGPLHRLAVHGRVRQAGVDGALGRRAPQDLHGADDADAAVGGARLQFGGVD